MKKDFVEIWYFMGKCGSIMYIKEKEVTYEKQTNETTNYRR